MTNDVQDVLIIGAGPVGMTLALTLRRAGASVTIVDKAPDTRRFSQAAVVWPRTLEVFDLLGIVDDWRGVGTPLRGFNFSFAGAPARFALDSIDSPHPQPLGVGQDVTERLLDARLKQSGADYRRAVEALDVQLDDVGVATTLRDTEGQITTLRSSWIVGCEGSHSLVREKAGLQRQGGRHAGLQLLQGDVRLGGPLTLEPGWGYLWSGNQQGALFILPFGVQGYYRVLVTLPDDGAHGEPSLADLQDLARRFVTEISLHDPIWLSRYRTQHQIADHYRAGKAFVCGDAAHVWVPIGGQGMNIGMQDAFDLGWKLAGVARGELPDGVLDTYGSERRPIGQANIAVTERLFSAIIQPHHFADALLRKVLPLALGLNAVESRLANRFAELDMHYAPSLLVADHGGTHGPSAGQRAPDVYLNRAGETIRLFDLMRAGRWIVLGWALQDHGPALEVLHELLADARWKKAPLDAFLVDATLQGVEDGQMASSAVLRDVPRLAVRAFGVEKPCLHVIRPDGIIGYRGPAEWGGLQGYLEGYLAPMVSVHGV